MNYGVYIKLTADILEIPCIGANGIYIEEKGGRAGPFCAKKKMPTFVSRDVFFDIHIIVETPLEVSNPIAEKILYSLYNMVDRKLWTINCDLITSLNHQT